VAAGGVSGGVAGAAAGGVASSFFSPQLFADRPTSAIAAIAVAKRTLLMVISSVGAQLPPGAKARASMLRETNGLYLIYAAYAPLDDDVRDKPHRH
jgi:hypothetical protein